MATGPIRVVARGDDGVLERAWGDGCTAWELAEHEHARLVAEHMPPGTAEVEHVHDGAHQWVVVTSGVLTVASGAHAVTVPAGAVAVIPRGIPHVVRNDGAEGAEFFVVAAPGRRSDRRSAATGVARTPGEVRRAVPGDAPELVRLRREMFVAMGMNVRDNAWEAPTVDALRVGIANEQIVGAVVDAPDGSDALAASGVVQLDLKLPSPSAPSSVRGYISNVCTDPQWRGRGYGTQVMEALLRECRARAVDVVDLHATPDGQRIYERLGFAPRPGSPEMRLVR